MTVALHNRPALACLAAVAALAFTTPALAAGGPDPTTATTTAAAPSARDLHAAQCVTALEASADDLAAQVKAGKEVARKTLLDRLVAGAAFVGEAYLHGDSNEDQARALVDQAAHAQRSLSTAALAARQAACANEGTRLFVTSNALQRAVVKRLAKRRMDRLLGT